MRVTLKVHVFSKYSKFYIVTTMLRELDLPDFNVLFDGYRCAFQRQTLLCGNGLFIVLFV